MISELKRLDLRGEYISASHIGAIIKHYKGYSFKTFNDIDFIASRIKWTSEEKKLYNEAETKLKGKIFQGGKDFEKSKKAELQKQYSSCEFVDWNDKDAGLFHSELKLYAIPDFVIKSKDFNLIIECKGSKSTTDNYSNYVYQLALQDLLLQLPDCVCSLIFKDKEIDLKRSEIKEKQNEIVECIKLFWEDFKNDKFKFLSCQDAIAKLEKDNKKIEHIETEETILNMVQEVIEWNNQKERIDTIKETLYKKYSNYTNVAMNVGEEFIKLSIVKDSKAIINKAYLESEIKKTEEKYKENIEKLTNQLKDIENKEPEEKVLRSGYIKFV
jgi:hypothetical protein